MNTQDTTDEEQWAPIPDFPGYEVSNRGRIRSYWKKIGYPSKDVLQKEVQRFLKTHIGRDTRERVTLYKNTQRRTFLIHRLVAIVFLPNPYNHIHIDHIDRNTLNNSVLNLRWASPHQNMLNRGINTRNKTGVKGVEYCPRQNFKKWKACWKENGKNVSKYFDTKEEAINYREQMVQRRYDTEFYAET